MTRLLFVVTTLTLIFGCSLESPPNPANASASPAPSNASSAVEVLDRMDTRAPVPLLPMMANHQKQNMRDHLIAVQEIIMALATDDFGNVEKAAGRLGSSDVMRQTCTHMGAGAPEFTEQALAFHRTADGIAEAARERDRTRVLNELSTTLQRCTSCHATWKQQVVDDSAWERITSSLPPTHGPSH